MAQRDGLNMVPPRDDDTEHKILGAVLVSDDDASTDPHLASLSVVFDVLEGADFGDPFRAWLFRLIGEARRERQTLRDRLRFMLARMNQRKAQAYGVDDLAWQLGRLLITAEGEPCCGKVACIRAYANRLREVRQYREHFEAASAELRRAHEQWEQARREQFGPMV